MTLQLDGQVGIFDLLPQSCRHCGATVDTEHPYDFHNFARVHADSAPGACEEMAWARRGYRHAIWAVENFGSWFDLAPPGSEIYEKQLQSMTEERDRFEARCAAYTARVGSAWLESAA